MDAADLQGQFRLGECLVEPRESRITGPAGEFVLEPAHFTLLCCLARSHGEAVSRNHLRQCAWPQGGGSDAALRAGMRALRAALGGSVRDRRYIVDAGPDGFALVARFERLPAGNVPVAPESPAVVPREAPHGLVGRLQHLVVELRRRNVFKVIGGYLVGMWLMLQVAETTFQPLHLPDWWLTALTILAVVGLPIVTALAWSYEITPGGIVLDSDLTGNVRLPRARRAVAPAIVLGVALMASVTGFAWWQSISARPDAPPVPPDPGYPSVAVLPLVDMSPTGGIAYLGDGLSEELSARLAQIPGLRVAARTSAFEFKGRNLDVRRIGEALGVRHVLEGSVRRDGDNLRVTVQLIDAANGYHVWAGSYDRGWRDVIAIQDDIARSVTEALRVVLTPQAQAQAGRTESAAPDVRAIDPYLAGLALLRQASDMSKMQEAEQQFADAIAISPSFARAHAGMCMLGVRLYRKTQDPAHVIRAEDSCRRALELDPTLLETEKGLAALYLASGRLEESEAIYRRLVKRYPGDADGHMGLGQVLEAAGRPEEAESSLRAAIQAEPAYWGSYASLGAFLFQRGRVDEATEAFREVTELAPSANSYSNLGAALQMKGDLDGAADAFRHSLAIEPSSSAYSNLGTVHYFRGKYEDAVTEYARATALTGQDQSLWGNLADALWQIAERRDEARGYYRRAIALAERQLESSPQDYLLVAQLGYYYGRVDDPERSRRYLERAAAARDDPHVAYYQAVAAADRGDLSAARDAMAEAARLGFPESLLQADPSLAAVGADKSRGT